jgi:flagella basal body P-ring formation protein FlgA
VNSALLVLGWSLAAEGDALVLLEQARVTGRWVRLADLLDTARSGPAARACAGEVWLGRAPEEGGIRSIGADEIRRELERRGMDAQAFEIRGARVEVRRGPAPDEAFKRAVAFEIRRHLLEKEEAGALSVQVLSLHPESVPGDLEPRLVRPRGGSSFTVLCSDGARTEEVLVEARILRPREVAFAAREIQPGKLLERADLEIRRIDCSGDEAYAPSPELLEGAAVAVRIRKGAALAASDVKPRPVVRKGDLVRASASGYEVDVRALADGAPGREIEVEFLGSRRRLRARVADAGRVGIVEEGR